MKLYSGKCLLAECGIETNIFDLRGNRCHTGDIVMLWSRYHEPEGEETSFDCQHGLTAIVEDKYTTYSDGAIKIHEGGNPFVMGIKNIDLNNTKLWGVEIVKKWSDVIDGEHWTSYGFNYKEAA